MSKAVNINPGQYKLKGRERQGDDLVPEREKKNAQRHAAPKTKAAAARARRTR
jgi:hypothetical protein